MKPRVLFGPSSIGEIALAYLQNANAPVAAFTCDREYIGDRSSFRGLPLVAFEEIEQHYPPAKFDMLVFVGYRSLNKVRTQKYEEAKKKGYALPSFIDPRAMVTQPCEIGENCFIFEGNVVQPYVKIGNNCILWSGNHIGHHSTIGANNFLSSHVVIAGNCHIGDSCFMGVNSTVANGVKVGSENVIAAGTLLLKDTLPQSIMVGQDRRLAKPSTEAKL